MWLSQICSFRLSTSIHFLNVDKNNYGINFARNFFLLFFDKITGVFANSIKIMFLHKLNGDHTFVNVLHNNNNNKGGASFFNSIFFPGFLQLHIYYWLRKRQCIHWDWRIGLQKQNRRPREGDLASSAYRCNSTCTPLSIVPISIWDQIHLPFCSRRYLIFRYVCWSRAACDELI